MLRPWHHALHQRGWAAPHWPKEYGGTGWTPMQRFIFENECARADAPPLSVFGLNLVGPTLYTFGTQAQKARYLPKILSGEEQWCQGYSEPEAGSDLAALRTVAHKTEDGWRLGGQKTWTSEAHMADLMICLARTDRSAKPQAGLSLFILDMKSPGISWTPILTIDQGHSVNAVFIDDVSVPDDALIGEPNKGWDYAKFLLNHERSNNAQVYRSRREYHRLLRLAQSTASSSGASMLDDPQVRAELVDLDVELTALEVSVLRTLHAESGGGATGGEAAILKMVGSELQQRLSRLSLAVLGRAAALAPHQPDGSTWMDELGGWMERHLFRRAVTIYGGANEIQKDIIARTILGLR